MHDGQDLVAALFQRRISEYSVETLTTLNIGRKEGRHLCSLSDGSCAAPGVSVPVMVVDKVTAMLSYAEGCFLHSDHSTDARRNEAADRRQEQETGQCVAGMGCQQTCVAVLQAKHRCISQHIHTSEGVCNEYVDIARVLVATARQMIAAISFLVSAAQ